MDWEPIVALAQIGTGIATLALASFLATQIVLQRKALGRAHEDAERELALFFPDGTLNWKPTQGHWTRE